MVGIFCIRFGIRELLLDHFHLLVCFDGKTNTHSTDHPTPSGFVIRQRRGMSAIESNGNRNNEEQRKFVALAVMSRPPTASSASTPQEEMLMWTIYIYETSLETVLLNL